MPKTRRWVRVAEQLGHAFQNLSGRECQRLADLKGTYLHGDAPFNLLGEVECRTIASIVRLRAIGQR